MAVTKARSTNSAVNDSRRQIIRAAIEKNLTQYFSKSLGKQEDMVNIFTALIFLESRFNVNATYTGALSYDNEYSGAADYHYSPVIQKILQTGNKYQIANEPQGRRAWGLTQSMGWNHIRGASKKNGVCEIERIASKKDGSLVARLTVAPGEDVSTILTGESNVENSVLAGLLILESKWDLCKQNSQGWSVGKSSQVFPSRISASIGAYLGLGKADKFGTTPAMYAASIVGGAMYKTANGTSAPAIRDSKIQYASSTSGPPITLASGSNQKPTGCISTKASAA